MLRKIELITTKYHFLLRLGLRATKLMALKKLFKPINQPINKFRRKGFICEQQQQQNRQINKILLDFIHIIPFFSGYSK